MRDSINTNNNNVNLNVNFNSNNTNFNQKNFNEKNFQKIFIENENEIDYNNNNQNLNNKTINISKDEEVYINNSSPEQKDKFFQNKNYKSNFIQHQNQINTGNNNNKFFQFDESEVTGGEAAIKCENSVYISDNHSLMIDKENLMKILPNFQNFNTIDLNSNANAFNPRDDNTINPFNNIDPLDSSKDSSINAQLNNYKKANLNNSSRASLGKSKNMAVSNFTNNTRKSTGFNNNSNNFPKANTITLSNTASAGFGVNNSNNNNTTRNTLSIANPFKSAVKSARGHSSSNTNNNANNGSDSKVNNSNTNRTFKGRISLLENHSSKRNSNHNLNKNTERAGERNRESNTNITSNITNNITSNINNNITNNISSNITSNITNVNTNTNTLRKPTNTNKDKDTITSNLNNSNSAIITSTSGNTRKVPNSTFSNNYNTSNNITSSITKSNNIPIPSYVTNSSTAHASNRTNRYNRKSTSRHYKMNYQSNANRYEVFSNYTSIEVNSGNNTANITSTTIKGIEDKDEILNNDMGNIDNTSIIQVNNNILPSDSIRTANTVNSLDKTTSKSKLSLGKYSHVFGDVVRHPLMHTNSNRHFKKASTEMNNQRVCSTHEGGSINGVDIVNAKSMSMNLDFNQFNECNDRESASASVSVVHESNIIVENIGSFINLEEKDNFA
jgi:hypothetical protein